MFRELKEYLLNKMRMSHVPVGDFSDLRNTIDKNFIKRNNALFSKKA